MKRAAHYQTLETELVRTLVRQWREERQGKVRVLDFGCGRGKYLEIFSAAGCETIGADINPAYVARLRECGFDVRDINVVIRGENRFDIIFLSHVVEHIPPDDLVTVIPKLARLVAQDGLLVIVTPILGERFYYDFSHVRPYYPQSIRHAFGQTDSPLSYGAQDCLELVDIHFFRDPYRTRKTRSFYVGTGIKRHTINAINRVFDGLWWISGGRIGVVSSWLGIYRVTVNHRD